MQIKFSNFACYQSICSAAKQMDQSSQEIIIRSHDGLIAQQLSKIIISTDGWFHTFQIAASERPTKQQFDRVAIAVPCSQSRFAPLNFFHGMSESLSTDPNAPETQQPIKI
jgi:hypothetical protein